MGEPTPLTVESCPVCGDPVTVQMPTDWQAAVEAAASVPIVGCGSPWHYVFPDAARQSARRDPAELGSPSEGLREVREEVAAMRTYPFKEAPYGDKPHATVLLSGVLDIIDAALARQPAPSEGLREVLKDDVRRLAYLTPEDWSERRGGDPIARTINAVFDIIDARFSG